MWLSGAANTYLNVKAGSSLTAKISSTLHCLLTIKRLQRSACHPSYRDRRTLHTKAPLRFCLSRKLFYLRRRIILHLTNICILSSGANWQFPPTFGQRVLCPPINNRHNAVNEWTVP